MVVQVLFRDRRSHAGSGNAVTGSSVDDSTSTEVDLKLGTHRGGVHAKELLVQLWQ